MAGELRIGIDFDNTLAGYDRVFRDAAVAAGLLPSGTPAGKDRVRRLVRALPDGETEWRRLQGRVYGRLMPEAELLPGADAFLERCRAEGATVFVVSHKTRYGHFDPDRIDLRRAARDWMAAQGFFERFRIDADAVFFEDDRAAKLARIKALALDHFIDDLPEVLADPMFPDGPQRHLYDGDWPRLVRAVFGNAD